MQVAEYLGRFNLQVCLTDAFHDYLICTWQSLLAFKMIQHVLDIYIVQGMGYVTCNMDSIYYIHCPKKDNMDQPSR